MLLLYALYVHRALCGGVTGVSHLLIIINAALSYLNVLSMISDLLENFVDPDQWL